MEFPDVITPESKEVFWLPLFPLVWEDRKGSLWEFLLIKCWSWFLNLGSLISLGHKILTPASPYGLCIIGCGAELIGWHRNLSALIGLARLVLSRKLLARTGFLLTGLDIPAMCPPFFCHICKDLLIAGGLEMLGLRITERKLT